MKRELIINFIDNAGESANLEFDTIEEFKEFVSDSVNESDNPNYSILECTDIEAILYNGDTVYFDTMEELVDYINEK